MTSTTATFASLALLALGCTGQAGLDLTASQHVTIEADHSNLDLTMKVPASGNRPEYLLSCRSWDFDGDVDYSGIQQCRLAPPDNKDGTNLLSENPGGPAWDNRSRFLAHQLVGGCATDPDWGAHRTYFAAGLKIQVDVDDVQRSGPDIARYKLTVRVKEADGEAAKPLSPRPAWFDNGPCPN